MLFNMLLLLTNTQLQKQPQQQHRHKASSPLTHTITAHSIKEEKTHQNQSKPLFNTLNPKRTHTLDVIKSQVHCHISIS